MTWLAIWDSSRLIHPKRQIRAPDLSQGVLTFQSRLRADCVTPTILWQGRTGTAMDFRVIHYPSGAVSVEHGLFRFETPNRFLAAGDPINLHYSWDVLGRTDTLVLENCESGDRLVAPVGPQQAPSLSALLPAPMDATVAIDHAGIANHFVPPVPLPGLATGAEIDTPEGRRPVETLRPGMLVNTGRHGPQPIRWIGRTEPLARGATAPIEMRAPYFGLSGDTSVTRNQRILLSGTDIEYLFGEDHVLARAGDLVNGRSARLCLTHATRVYHHILLDDHDCLTAGRCRFESVLLGDILLAQGKSPACLGDDDREAAWPTLDRAAAQSYLALLGANGRIAA